jgi:hypothetical protein
MVEDRSFNGMKMGKSKSVPLIKKNTMKVCMGSGGKASGILNLAMLRSLYP